MKQPARWIPSPSAAFRPRSTGFASDARASSLPTACQPSAMPTASLSSSTAASPSRERTKSSSPSAAPIFRWRIEAAADTYISGSPVPKLPTKPGNCRHTLVRCLIFAPHPNGSPVKGSEQLCCRGVELKRTPHLFTLSYYLSAATSVARREQARPFRITDLVGTEIYNRRGGHWPPFF